MTLGCSACTHVLVCVLAYRQVKVQHCGACSSCKIKQMHTMITNLSNGFSDAGGSQACLADS